MESDLETRNEMLEEFFEDMPFGVIFLGQKQEVLKVNGVVEELFKIKIKKYEDIPEKLRYFVQKRRNFEKKVVAIKGKILYVRHNVLVKNKVFKGNILILQDVTKSQLKEDIRLKEVQQEKEILAEIISHEVRNSLNLIQGFTQLMKESNEIGFIKKNLKIISDETTRMSRFVQDVLAFTKEEELLYEEFDIVENLREILFFTKGAEIVELISSEAEIEIKGDKDKLKQVFLNLINNGLNAIEKLDMQIFKIIITEFYEKIEIKFVTNYDERKEINMGKLFKPYFTTKNEGSGLGLSICRKLIKQHKGEIFAYKNDYNGLTFKIILKKSKKYKVVEKSDEL